MPLFLVKLQKLNLFPFNKAGNPLSYWGMSFLEKLGIKILEYTGGGVWEDSLRLLA